ncbi:MAG: phage holin family protein [Balneolaceae bacterium]|nr:phage holin family protein [Balneolaceae bacterium]
MMIYTLLINSIAVYLTAKLLDGVELKGFLTAVIVAILLALVNTFVKPLIVFLTLPLTIITLGLFILVINAFMLVLVDAMVDSFKIKSFGWAVIFSIILSILNSLLFWIF